MTRSRGISSCILKSHGHLMYALKYHVLLHGPIRRCTLFRNLFDVCCGEIGRMWVGWNYLATPKHMNYLAILDLSIHMLTRRLLLLEYMCSNSLAWISIAQYIIEKVIVTHGMSMINAS